MGSKQQGVSCWVTHHEASDHWRGCHPAGRRARSHLVVQDAARHRLQDLARARDVRVHCVQGVARVHDGLPLPLQVGQNLHPQLLQRDESAGAAGVTGCEAVKEGHAPCQAGRASRRQLEETSAACWRGAARCQGRGRPLQSLAVRRRTLIGHSGPPMGVPCWCYHSRHHWFMRFSVLPPSATLASVCCACCRACCICCRCRCRSAKMAAPVACPERK